VSGNPGSSMRGERNRWNDEDDSMDGPSSLSVPNSVGRAGFRGGRLLFGLGHLDAPPFAFADILVQGVGANAPTGAIALLTKSRRTPRRTGREGAVGDTMSSTDESRTTATESETQDDDHEI